MAKITIQKKTQTDTFEELSKILNIPDLKNKFPVRSMEPWRRFDPANLVPAMTDAARNGTSFSNITYGTGSVPGLKTAEQWKKEDELFLKKSLNKLDLFHSTEATIFFEKFISNSVPQEHMRILRITKDTQETPMLQIIPDDIAKLNFTIFYIYCEENSNADLSIIKNSSRFDSSLIYIFQEKNSHLKIKYLDENMNTASSGVSFVKSFQENYSHFDAGIYSTSAKQNKKFFIENSLSEYAQCKYTGIFTGVFSHVDHDFFIEHKGSFSISELLFKMGVLDECYGIFWGDTEIVPLTKGCEGYQQNKNLLLGKNARVDAIPRLRIQTENVIASHGSATGEISDDEIFYLTSRGLTYEEARKLLLRGFFEDVLRQSFGSDPDIANPLLAKIWSNIQQIIGMEITT